GELAGRPGGVRISSGFSAGDWLVDFTRPEGTLANLEQCVTKGMRMVIGTTGFSAAQNARIAEGAKRIAIVQAPNMSAGVNLGIPLCGGAGPRAGRGCVLRV